MRLDVHRRIKFLLHRHTEGEGVLFRRILRRFTFWAASLHDAL